VAPPGGPSRDVTVEGNPVNYQFMDSPPAPVRPPVTEVNLPPVPATVYKPIQLKNRFFEYRIIEPDIAYMNFFSIFDGLETVSRFEKAVDQMFTLVASDRPRMLIIDVRENGGGEDSAANALLRHLTEKRFRLLTSIQLKRSKETRAFISSMIRIPFRWMGLPYLDDELRRYYTGRVGTLSEPIERSLDERPRAEPFFDGPVCVLTGLYTYSAGVEFAEAVKTFGLATIVGEETGGQPNSFGNAFPFSLPRSQLSVSIATARGVRANGDLADFRPVTPDIVVRTTAADMRRGFDPVLERAKSCAPRSIR
jgi:C-terminal processing protease CtpA/Prc